MDGYNLYYGLLKDEGFYSKKKAWLPHVNGKCKTCEESPAGMAHVVKLEEKRSDVNLAVAVLVDAMRSNAECFVLILIKRELFTRSAVNSGKPCLYSTLARPSPTILNERQPIMRTSPAIFRPNASFPT